MQSTFVFSAAAMLSGCGPDLFTEAASADPVTGGIAHFLMVGDWGVAGSAGNPADQASVAAAMQTYAERYSLDTDALLMLGDNFYDQMPGGVASPRWQTQFEQMYPQNPFNCPAFAVPGNHDYQDAPQSKYDAELAYAALGTSRWTMPAAGYSRFLFPTASPLVTFITLDSNMPNEPAQPIPPNPSYYTLTDAERLTQLAWLTGALAEPLTTPFLVVLAHHPVYSDGPHGDNQTLIRDWDPLFQQAGVHLYLGGHDHDLQHLELAGHPTSFFLSGAGGATLDAERTSLASRGPYFQEVHGFSHLQVKPDLMILRHLDINGNLLHKFTKTPAGVVTILK